MKRALGAAATVIALTVTGCGGDSGGSDGGDASGDYDKDKYCGLVKDGVEAETPDPPKGENREAYMKYFDTYVEQALADTAAIVAAAPADQKDNWQALADVQKEVAANGRAFLEPANFEKFRAKPEDERAMQLFEVLLGPYAEVDEAQINAVTKHAKDECGIDLDE